MFKDRMEERRQKKQKQNEEKAIRNMKSKNFEIVARGNYSSTLGSDMDVSLTKQSLKNNKSSAKTTPIGEMSED